MGDDGSRPISKPEAVSWYENHPTRPSGRSLPVLTIIFWVSEDGSLSRAVGWLKEAIPNELRFKKLDQAVHRHVEGILAEMSQFGLVSTKEDKLALAKKSELNA